MVYILLLQNLLDTYSHIFGTFFVTLCGNPYAVNNPYPTTSTEEYGLLQLRL